VTLTTYRRLLAAEWTKLRSLRSTTWTLTAMVASSLGMCALICAVNAHDFSTFSASDRATWDPTNTSLVGTIVGQLAIAVFGVLAVTAEYASGTIRASLTAVPHRGRFLAAKASVYAAVALVVGEVVSFGSFLMGQAIFSGKAPTATLAHLDVVRAVGLAGVYLAFICLIAMAIGTMLRHTAAAITTVVALLLVVPGILSALPGTIGDSISRFLPEQIAGSSMAAVVPEAHAFGPLAGTALLGSYVVVVLIGAAALLRRRDV
jgi:ABC-type transport system involved in multi-copper enzyme maturation permease subunit